MFHKVLLSLQTTTERRINIYVRLTKFYSYRILLIPLIEYFCLRHPSNVFLSTGKYFLLCLQMEVHKEHAYLKARRSVHISSGPSCRSPPSFFQLELVTVCSSFSFQQLTTLTFFWNYLVPYCTAHLLEVRMCLRFLNFFLFLKSSFSQTYIFRRTFKILHAKDCM